MDDQYSIENLIPTFQEQHEVSERQYRELEKRYLEEFGHEYPHMRAFSISLALKAMCEEIIYLRERDREID